MPAVGALAAAAALEVYWLLTVRIGIPRSGRGVIYVRGPPPSSAPAPPSAPH